MRRPFFSLKRPAFVPRWRHQTSTSVATAFHGASTSALNTREIDEHRRLVIQDSRKKREKSHPRPRSPATVLNVHATRFRRRPPSSFYNISRTHTTYFTLFKPNTHIQSHATPLGRPRRSPRAPMARAPTPIEWLAPRRFTSRTRAMRSARRAPRTRATPARVAPDRTLAHGRFTSVDRASTRAM